MSDSRAAVERHCVGLPGGVKEYPFGESAAVFKVGGKMFALLTEDAEPAQVSLKLPPEEGAALRQEYPDHVLPGYHLNKRHWNTVVLDGTLALDEVLELVAQSYGLVVVSLPARLRPGADGP